VQANGEVRVLIGGRDLVDLARAAELPQATADGHPGLAGSYAGLTASEWRDLREEEDDGRTTVLGCTCRVAACWPLRVSIRRLGGTVEWSDFHQPCRAWSYEALGPFLFKSEEYDREVAAVLRRAKP
jgi:hypothetical protein